jgi:acetolactate decarboxylase
MTWVKIVCAAIVAVLASLSPLHADDKASAGSESPLVRYSLMSAIKNGYLNANLDAAEILRQGDFGLGGFAGFSGELILIDQVLYKVPLNGVPSVADPKDLITYAEFTKFSPGTRIRSAGESKSALLARITKQLANPNIFYSVRIDGTFARIRYRTVHEQKAPFPRVICAKNIDHVFERMEVRGTIMGFLHPTFVKGGIDYPGSHLHFLDDARTIGGHIYDFDVGDATVAIGKHHDFTIRLPTAASFAELNIEEEFACPPQN